MSEIIDNRAHRIRTLKGIIRGLHTGESAEAVKERLRVLVKESDYSEIVAMEQELMAEGMPVSEIQAMCDLHSQVTRDLLVQIVPKAVPPGHPVDTFRRENEALRGALVSLRQSMAEMEGLADGAPVEIPLLSWRQAANDLQDIDKHYQRKEHAFFPRLELHGITGPPKVMWGKDDEVRALLKELAAALEQQEATVEEWRLLAGTVGQAVAQAVEEMIYKEENIFLPLCSSTFTEEDWGEIALASPRYGWCLVEPRDGYQPPASLLGEATRMAGDRAVHLDTGSVSFEQLVGIFSTLPVDLTFVDAEDRVAFFSEGPDRVFARSKAVLGRKVQHCHPPRSVDVVERIVSDFREGRQSVAEFWIPFQGRFVHIRYLAVRDGQGRYLGTLEVTQDLTRLRGLTGERRLLQYDGAGPAEAAS